MDFPLEMNALFSFLQCKSFYKELNYIIYLKQCYVP